MKKALAILAIVVTAASASHAAIVINEVYAGGGASTGSPAYKNDFVELYNNGATAVDLTGYTLAYGSSTQTAGNFPTAIGTLTGSIAPGGFFLVQTGGAGTAGANNPPADNTFGTGASLSNSAGAVRLADAASNTLDVLGWGSVNNFEGTAETAPASTAVSMMRTVDGVDTGNNQNDFSQGTPTPISAVPEPATVGLVGFGLLALAVRRSRKS